MVANSLFVPNYRRRWAFARRTSSLSVLVIVLARGCQELLLYYLLYLAGPLAAVVVGSRYGQCA